MHSLTHTQRHAHTQGVCVYVCVLGESAPFFWFDDDDERALMIPPQVHLRRPCYDFSFL